MFKLSWFCVEFIEALAAFFVKELFNDAVFQRVEGNDGQLTLRVEAVECLYKPPFEVLELLVDVNANSLKNAGGGVNARLFRP